MKIYDRMYGEYKFPPIILDLLDCPGLLRLRNVRMANNQFVAFPAFATTTRYEHSLGVCHLAGICANTIGLNEKERIELMIACLYHDVGTPPFAHAMEEVLQARFGFDHEENLKNLILGTTGQFDGEMAQIYQGEGLKIRSVCQGSKARKLRIDIHKIAKLAVGDKNEYLSPLLNGNGIDLDNIDNILRASSAMGLISRNAGEMAQNLAASFLINENKVYYNGLFSSNISDWQRIRDIQYSAIYESVDDFAYQTMIKKAIVLLLDEKNGKFQLDVNSWRLTDSELTEKLLNTPQSCEIMRRVMLCRPYECLGILYVSGEQVSQFINMNLREIEVIVGDFFASTLGLGNKRLASSIVGPVVANFFPDKRKRQINRHAIIWNEEVELDNSKPIKQGALLGLFTPFSNSSYKLINDKRRNVKFGKEDLQKVIDVLAKGILSGYDITIYGSNDNGEAKTNIKSNQLEFCGL